MNLLVVVQRYGERVAGGAEQLTKQYAERLVARGHHVEIVTSCAESHADWANVYAPGISELNGVVIHRLPVAAPWDNRLFGPLNLRVSSEPSVPISSVLADAWSAGLGPDMPTLVPYLLSLHRRFNAAFFSGYLYETSVVGLPALAPFLPTVLLSVAHDEPHLRLPPIRRLVDHAAGICALTEEEARLLVRRFRPSAVVEVVGGGVEPVVSVGRDADLRRSVGIVDQEYVVSVGRIEPGKGSIDLLEFFLQYRERLGVDLRLVLVGNTMVKLPSSDGCVVTGFVDEPTKWAVMRGARALIQPSYFESFSLSLVEGWLAGLPALVQGRCAVLAGQVERSGGGLTYRSFAEFGAGLDFLLDRRGPAGALAANGAAYAARYEWSTVLDHFEELIDRSREHWSLGRSTTLREPRAHVQT